MVRSKIAALVVLTLSLAACESESCEDSDARLQSAFEACDVMVPANSACVEGDERLFSCTADCAEDAPCGALDGTDPDAVADYGQCVLDCG